MLRVRAAFAGMAMQPLAHPVQQRTKTLARGLDRHRGDMAREYLDDLGVDAFDQRFVGGGTDGVADGTWIRRAVRDNRDSTEPQQRRAAVLGRVQTVANRTQALA